MNFYLTPHVPSLNHTSNSRIGQDTGRVGYWLMMSCKNNFCTPSNCDRGKVTCIFIW